MENVRSEKDGTLTYEEAKSIYEEIASGLDENDVILCAFVYDGSRALYRDVKTITAAADIVGREYNNFYCTYINISR